jgi:Tol biopolymer transport system component
VLVGGTYEIRESAVPGFTQTYPGGGGGARTTDRVSVDSAGGQAQGASALPAVSADGRYVAFESTADNLVPGDTNSASDIFVFDRQTRRTERVSIPDVGLGQTQGNADSTEASISDDGRYVAFESQANNLIAGDHGPYTDVFVHDRVTGRTQRMSEDASGVGGNAPSGDSPDFGPLKGPSISADGRFVAFASLASNLVPRNVFVLVEVFVKDRQTGAIERISVTQSGDVPRGNISRNPAVSGDGRFVSFTSFADLTEDGGGVGSFVFDRQTRSLERIPAKPDFAPMSFDGRFLVFASSASALVPNDTNAMSDVFVFDRQSGATERVSLDAAGNQVTGASLAPAISSDGRFVAFSSNAASLVPGDTNDAYDVFVKDHQTGAIERVSVDSAGNQAAGAGSQLFSGRAALSGDGKVVAFESTARNLVPGDTNSERDVFVHQPGGTGPHRVTLVVGDRV